MDQEVADALDVDVTGGEQAVISPPGGA